MTEPASSGNWWRFRSYEIRDGFIRPTANSRLETYDVFEGFTASGASKGGHPKRPERRPYSGLLELDEVSGRRHSLENSEATMRDAILAYSSSYGLLGTGLERTERVVFAPRVEDPECHQIPRLGRVVVQRGYQSRGGRWESLSPRIGRPSLAKSGTIPDIRYDQQQLFELPHAVVADPVTQETKREKLSDSWAHYFPDVPADREETYDYPALFSEQFWREYAEPVSEFIDVAGRFAFAVSCVQSCLDPNPELRPDLRRDLKSWLPSELGKLNRWLSRVSPAVAIRGVDEVETTWVCSSLISMMALLAHFDLTSRGRILSCLECNRVFYSRATAAKYCSPRCRQTTQTRRYRAGLRAGAAK